MTRAERLAVLGETTVAESHGIGRRACTEWPPPAEAVEKHLRPVLAPALARVRAAHAAQQTPAAA